MTDEKKYKKAQVEGTIQFPGYGDAFFYLLHYKPVHLDSWLSDSERAWYVAQDKGRAFHIVTKGDYLLSYMDVGKEIDVLDKDELMLNEFQVVFAKTTKGD